MCVCVYVCVCVGGGVCGTGAVAHISNEGEGGVVAVASFSTSRESVLVYAMHAGFTHGETLSMPNHTIHHF